MNFKTLLSLVIILGLSFHSLALAAYQDDVDALNPTHYWTFDNTLNDRGLGIISNGTFESGAAFGAAITADSTNAIDVGTGQVTVGNTTDMNDGSNRYQTRTFSTWFQADDLSSPTVIWEEGAGVNNFAIAVGVARNVQVQAADEGAYYLTLFADNLIEQGKPYHIAYTWERGTTTGGAGTRLRMWLNGVEQGTSYLTTDPSTAEFPSHTGDINFGNTNETLKFYNDDTLQYIDRDKSLAHFAIWNDVLLSEAQIQTLFENGAAPTTSTLTLLDVPSDTSISLHEVDALGGNLVSETNSTVRDPGGEVILTYPVTTFTPSRLRLTKYGFDTFSTDVRLDRFPTSVPFFITTDANITESDASVVRGYSNLASLDQFYDRSRAYDEDTPSNGFDVLSPSGNTLDLGSFDVVFDATAGSAFTLAGNTVTVNTSTLSCGGGQFGKLLTSGTITFVNGATAGDCVMEDVNGETSVLQIQNVPVGATVYVEDDSDAQQDYVASFAGGNYSLSIPNTATGTWTYAVKQPGFDPVVSTFDPTGGFFTFSVNLIQKKQPDGSVMYTGTTDALVDIEFTGTTQLNIDIADGLVSSQTVLDEVEQALTTSSGMAWLAAGGGEMAIANLSAGNFIFMDDNVRFRRNAPGDVNATVNAFAISTQSVVTDGLNGSVTFLSSSEVDDVATAVWNRLLTDHNVSGSFGELVKNMAGPTFDVNTDSLSNLVQSMRDEGIVDVNTLKDLVR